MATLADRRAWTGRSTATGARRSRTFTVVLAAAMLAGTPVVAGCEEKISLSKDWSSVDAFAVVKSGHRRLLVGIDVAKPQVLPLAYLPVAAPPPGEGATAVVSLGDAPAIFAGDGSGFGADVLRVDVAARTVRQIGNVPSGRFPMRSGEYIEAVGGAESVSALVTYVAEPSKITQRESRTLPILVVAGDGRCLVGNHPATQKDPATTVVIADGSEPRTLQGYGAPSDVSCRPGVSLVSFAAAPPTGDPDMDKSPAPSHTVVLLRADTPPAAVDVGAVPGHVRLVNDQLAAVDVGSGSVRALRVVDLTSGAVRSEATIESSQLSMMEIVRERILAFDSRHVTIVDPGTGQTHRLDLYGDNETYLSSLS